MASLSQPPNPNPNSKPYDLVILGASGFTGKRVLREALKFLPSSHLQSIAVAGRSPARLRSAVEWAAAPAAPPEIPAIQTDTSNPESLVELAKQTRLILSCVGPFRIHGRPVVEACVEAGTDYLDITGEPEFMERMEAEFHDKAVERSALTVSGCGFDSVPAELGVLFNAALWAPPSLVNRVEAFLCLESPRRVVGNLGTFESAVLGVASARSLRELRKSLPRRVRPKIPGPPPPKGPLIHHQKDLGLWAIKLPSADATVVRRTQSTIAALPHGVPGLAESPSSAQAREAFWASVKPAHFGVKLGSKSLLGLFRTIVTGFFIGLFGTFAFGRSLLLKYPEFFSAGWFRKTGPTEQEINSATFNMWFVGEGFSDESLLLSQPGLGPDKQIVTRVSGPEIGYVTTPIAIVQCALLVLGKRGDLPKGGVYTPGVVFGPTDLQKRLEENGISFDVVSIKNL